MQLACIYSYIALNESENTQKWGQAPWPYSYPSFFRAGCIAVIFLGWGYNRKGEGCAHA